MDLAIWPEASVLRTIRDVVTHAPRLLYASDDPQFQIHAFIDGEQLDAFAPRGVPVPGHVIGDVGEVFSQLGAVPRESIPALPADWPADGKTIEFARRLSAITEGVYERFLPEYGDLYALLGIPSDPLSLVLARWTTLQPRPFRLLHTDLHRKNMIVSHGRTYFLDWELALWGDPVYDLAVHLHKMGYVLSDYGAAQSAWLASVPREAAEGWELDLDTYLTHERVKSAIVDTIRYTKIIVSGRADNQSVTELIRKLSAKLEAAQATGGNWPARKSLGPDKIMSIIRDWARKRPE
jgi:aminoglycoside phosphotransferase (APT) family kinase protein